MLRDIARMVDAKAHLATAKLHLRHPHHDCRPLYFPSSFYLLPSPSLSIHAVTKPQRWMLRPTIQVAEATCWSSAAEPLAKHLYAQHLSRLPCYVTLPEWWMLRLTLQPPSFTCVILTMTVVRSIFPPPFTCFLPHHYQFML